MTEAQKMIEWAYKNTEVKRDEQGVVAGNYRLKTYRIFRNDDNSGYEDNDTGWAGVVRKDGGNWKFAHAAYSLAEFINNLEC